jgi:hypothetical protein
MSTKVGNTTINYSQAISGSNQANLVGGQTVSKTNLQLGYTTPPNPNKQFGISPLPTEVPEANLGVVNMGFQSNPASLVVGSPLPNEGVILFGTGTTLTSTEAILPVEDPVSLRGRLLVSSQNNPTANKQLLNLLTQITNAGLMNSLSNGGIKLPPATSQTTFRVKYKDLLTNNLIQMARNSVQNIPTPGRPVNGNDWRLALLVAHHAQIVNSKISEQLLQAVNSTNIGQTLITVMNDANTLLSTVITFCLDTIALEYYITGTMSVQSLQASDFLINETSVLIHTMFLNKISSKDLQHINGIVQGAKNLLRFWALSLNVNFVQSSINTQLISNIANFLLYGLQVQSLLGYSVILLTAIQLILSELVKGNHMNTGDLQITQTITDVLGRVNSQFQLAINQAYNPAANNSTGPISPNTPGFISTTQVNQSLAMGQQRTVVNTSGMNTLSFRP